MSGSNKEYRGGALKLKGNKQLFKKARSTKDHGENSKSSLQIDEDRQERGGWRRIEDEFDLRGGIEIAIECGDFSKCYLAAQDNGKFIVGAKHFDYGEPPNPEEILTLIKSPDDPKISLKTGFGKYVGVDAEGFLIATAEAIGARERFDVIFQEGKCAIQSTSSTLFLCLDPDEEGYVCVCSRIARDKEIINIRTNVDKVGPTDWRSAEDKKKAADCEQSYIKMYQHSRVDLKNRMINYDPRDKSSVRQAQDDGTLHETLLDRRVKRKSDKYC